MQLAGEEVYTQVTVLASLRRHGDANDFGGTALQEENITNADEVALDGHTATTKAWLDEANLLNCTIADASGPGGLPGICHHNLLTRTTVMVMVVGEWMHDTVCGTFDSAAEAVVFTLVVVVTHVSSSNWLIDFDLFFLYSDFWSGGAATVVLDVVGYSLSLDSDVGSCWAATFVFNVVGRVDASTVVTFSDVYLIFGKLVVSLAAVVIDFNVVSGVSAVDFDVNVGTSVLGRSSVSVGENALVIKASRHGAR